MCRNRAAGEPRCRRDRSAPRASRRARRERAECQLASLNPSHSFRVCLAPRRQLEPIITMAERNSGSNKPKGGRKNTVSQARMQSSRSGGFYILLGLLAVAGIGILAYVVTRPKKSDESAVSAVTDTANAGPPQGYSAGKADAPIKLIEFGDFECPQCARFSTLTEPDMRKRLVAAGQVQFIFY